MFQITRLFLCVAVLAGIGCSEDLVLPTAESPGAESGYEQLESAAEHEAQSTVGLQERIFGPVTATRVSIEGGIPRKPTVWTYTVEREHLDQFASPFLMVVTNGNPDGTGRVSTGAVVIDGNQILGPSDFSPNVARLEREVEIHTGSVLSVRVNGAPDGVLLVEILGTRIVPEGFVYIAPGTFVMGSPSSEPQRLGNETQHTVTLTRGFYMSKYEVTWQWWSEVMGGSSTTPLLPRGFVSWDMAVRFCNELSSREGLTPAYTILGTNGDVTWNRSANGYRLPTEAEWEYACRAGTTTAYHNDTNCLSSDTEANYDGEAPLTGCPSGTHRLNLTNVGSFPANAWGLYDMHGNVCEWVWDRYRTDYQNLPATDPVHDGGRGSYRVFRGGNWLYPAHGCRSAFRRGTFPAPGFNSFGFRPVRSAF